MADTTHVKVLVPRQDSSLKVPDSGVRHPVSVRADVDLESSHLVRRRVCRQLEPDGSWKREAQTWRTGKIGNPGNLDNSSAPPPPIAALSPRQTGHIAVPEKIAQKSPCRH
ncbi:hypothetical protein E4U09_002571 [Claviceps aff. purpurea]|uniref:Uncharacterized protein n=1 Tax=Claviceps aff. purpurea TaxID=1967640 RepID=A0A9P7U5T5_9HYPO|nr:hypothetical protein E4U09_002571 [Claviceps aff. purpurea]